MSPHDSPIGSVPISQRKLYVLQNHEKDGAARFSA